MINFETRVFLLTYIDLSLAELIELKNKLSSNKPCLERSGFTAFQLNYIDSLIAIRENKSVSIFPTGEIKTNEVTK